MKIEQLGSTVRLTDEQLFLAESICDEISEYIEDNDQKMALANLRFRVCCSRSEIGSHACSVQTSHGYCCDTCLQAELHDLWKRGIKTIGSCCGHGALAPYIQVAPHYVQKMHEIGYVERRPDENGNGQNCFIPKTFLPVYRACSECKKAVIAAAGEYLCVARDFDTVTKKCFEPVNKSDKLDAPTVIPADHFGEATEMVEEARDDGA